MGMDITGRNPKIRGEAPKEIDWFNSTQEEKDAYMNAKNEFQDNNPGVYFRANLCVEPFTKNLESLLNC
jgi:hypothetical protein